MQCREGPGERCWVSGCQESTASVGCYTSRKENGHLVILEVDIGTRSDELVDEAKPALVRSKVEKGLAILRGHSAGTTALKWRRKSGSGARL
jgi:hypothetical protein